MSLSGLQLIALITNEIINFRRTNHCWPWSRSKQHCRRCLSSVRSAIISHKLQRMSGQQNRPTPPNPPERMSTLFSAVKMIMWGFSKEHPELWNVLRNTSFPFLKEVYQWNVLLTCALSFLKNCMNHLGLFWLQLLDDYITLYAGQRDEWNACCVLVHQETERETIK